jgi:biofilm PGA synthesis N-glycosyltransferase PgaC
MGAILVFTAASLAVFYIVVGFPLLLELRVRRSARPVVRADYEPSISVLMAVHNGARFVSAKLRSILALEYPRQKMEILVGSDGSTDGTNEIVREFAAEGVRLLELARGGKCAALNAVAAQARGEILLLTDVRQLLEPASVRRMMRCFADPSVGVVSGHLVIGAGDLPEQADIRLYWRYEIWIRNRLSQLDSMFGATGALYAIRRELAVPLPNDVLLDDMYLPLEGAFRRGYRCVVALDAIAYDTPTTREAEFSRKVRTLAGNFQLWRTSPWLFGFSNRRLFDYLSYKAGRLILPMLLVVMAGTSVFLPAPWRETALAGQALFYGMAAADPLVPQRIPLKRATSAARSFVVMMAAAVCGLAVFFVPARRLWKQTGSQS